MSIFWWSVVVVALGLAAIAFGRGAAWVTLVMSLTLEAIDAARAVDASRRRPQ